MKRKLLKTMLALVLLAATLPITNVSAAGEAAVSLEAPRNLTVEVNRHEDGKPYFKAKWTNPQSILDLYFAAEDAGEAPLSYQIDMKVGDGDWNYDIIGNTIPGNGLYRDEDEEVMSDGEYDPINSGDLGTIDIKANTYQFRIRYTYLLDNEDFDEYAYSPFSNIVSIGTNAFYKDASEWAKPELVKANDLGLIPDSLKGADMTKPITRAEFAAVSVKVYEALSGVAAAAYPTNPFTDTKDTEVLKAYNLGITTGTSPTTFTPKALLNREQASAMLTRVYKKVSLNGWTIQNDGQFTLPYTKPAPFADDAKISAWATDSVYFMAVNGIINGTGNNMFSPRATTPAEEAINYASATREQALAIAVRMTEKLK